MPISFFRKIFGPKKGGSDEGALGFGDKLAQPRTEAIRRLTKKTPSLRRLTQKCKVPSR